MLISARVHNAEGRHEASVATNERSKSVAIPAKDGGRGSSLNGGELLMLALATCYCNDLFREAARLGIPLESVEVEASAKFEGVGAAASEVRYRARVRSSASREEVERLLAETDRVAEIQNTVRDAGEVVLEPWGPEE